MRDLLGQFGTNVALVVAALLIFFISFVVIVIWTFRRSGKRHYQTMARMPLDDPPADERMTHE